MLLVVGVHNQSVMRKHAWHQRCSSMLVAPAHIYIISFCQRDDTLGRCDRAGQKRDNEKGKEQDWFCVYVQVWKTQLTPTGRAWSGDVNLMGLALISANFPHLHIQIVFNGQEKSTGAWKCAAEEAELAESRRGGWDEEIL